MPFQPNRARFNLYGLVLWGDIGPLTAYRNKRHQLVIFSKTWPKKPATPKQQTQRDLFKDAADSWNDLTDEKRQQWDLAARRASLCMTGYNLWVHWYLTEDDSAIQTLERQTNTDLLPPQSSS